ncbi:MAG: class I SAM-dependent methyltransferase [Anaerolineales bacterium]|uniref:Class I SAM-dependent methyltransferase n=1 Tax=Candidatus Desulfolinea nitratireducens TaxID=2841698 RepID=A0A8J6TIG7_9CHLR|nr:class I SAM-dependent methyltransferase [Candidatus Desulfolinea nitratireducens]
MRKPNFFSKGSPFLAHPLLTPERTNTEIDFLLAQTQSTPGHLILDVGCGPGRHSIELARRGYRVVGIDPSEAMIVAAKERAKEAGVNPEFIQAHGEDFLTEYKFDAAICLFTTLGQINDDASSPKINNHPLLNQISQVLVPGGPFVLEVPQKKWVVNTLKDSDHFGDDRNYTDIQRAYDPESNILSETFRLVSPGETNQFFLRYHLYDVDEIHIFLNNAGFEVLHTYGDYRSAPVTEESPNIVVVAQLER